MLNFLLSEYILSFLMNKLSDFFWVRDCENGEIVYYNISKNSSQIPFENYLKGDKLWSEIVSIDDKKKFDDFLLAIIVNDECILEHKIIFNDQITWVEVFVNNFTFTAQKYQFGSLRNITENKKAEKTISELNSTLKKFKSAIMGASIVSITDKLGIITYVNQNFIDISGYSYDELIGKTHQLINSNYHSAEFWSEMWQTVHLGKIWRAEVCNKNKNGDFYWVDSFIIPFLEDDGSINQFMSIRNDISEKKAQELQIIDTENKLLAYFNSGFDAHLLLNQKLELIFFNKQAEILCQFYSNKKITLNSFMLDYMPEAQRLEVVKNCKKAFKGEIVEIERLTKTYDKKEIWLRTTYSPIYDKNNLLTSIALNVSDVTKRKIAENQIIEQNEVLQEIAWIQSHKVRAPLANILGLVSLIETTDPEQQIYLEYLQKASSELDVVIHEIVEKANDVYFKLSQDKSK